MRSARILTAAALAATSLSAAETRPTPPAAAKAVIAPSVPTPLPGIISALLPDLRIKEKPHNPNSALFDFLIENVGKAPSTETTIDFYAKYPCTDDPNHPKSPLGAGVFVHAGKVKALVVTTSPSYAFSYSVEMPEALRGCYLEAVVNARHQVVESSYDNNLVRAYTATPPRPDLKVGIGFQKATGRTYDSIFVTNSGRAPAGASVMRVWTYTTQSGGSTDYQVPALAVGQSHEFRVQLPQFAGNVKIQLDATYAVDESNEENNFWPPQY